MTTTALDREATKAREAAFIKKLQETTIMEDCMLVFRDEKELFSHEINEAYVAHMDSIMRKHIAGIKTPDDVLAVHNHFKNLHVHHTVIQKELGEKAKEIFGSWIPDSNGAGGSVHWC
jgi:hypothetical protein